MLFLSGCHFLANFDVTKASKAFYIEFANYMLCKFMQIYSKLTKLLHLCHFLVIFISTCMFVLSDMAPVWYKLQNIYPEHLHRILKFMLCKLMQIYSESTKMLHFCNFGVNFLHVCLFYLMAWLDRLVLVVKTVPGTSTQNFDIH